MVSLIPDERMNKPMLFLFSRQPLVCFVALLQFVPWTLGYHPIFLLSVTKMFINKEQVQVHYTNHDFQNSETNR